MINFTFHFSFPNNKYVVVRFRVENLSYCWGDIKLVLMQVRMPSVVTTILWLHRYITVKHYYFQVILATNIAESSVTIPKVAYVIDSCRSLQVFWDGSRKRDAVQLVWVSRSQVLLELPFMEQTWMSYI